MSKQKFDASMFAKVKDVLNKTKGGGGQYENILKFPPGHTYTLRLLPILEEGKDPLYHYYIHQWKAPIGGKFTSALSLQTFGENDPIANYRWKQFKAWKDANPGVENKHYKGEIDQKEQWAINVLVVDYPEKPELNGTVKILRFGPQIKKIIDAATEGVRADELGWDIFNPTVGYDLKIVAEEKGEFTTFESSVFTTKSKLKLSDEKLEELYETLHDLTTIEPVKTESELKDLLDEHFGDKEEEAKEERKPLAKKKEKAVKPSEEAPFTVDDTPDDDIPMEHEGDSSTDDEIDELLAGL